MKNEWKKVGGHLLQKEWKFHDFAEAIDFVNRVGKIAEELQHHPDICIKNYNQVVITTTSHDSNNVLTEKDYKLAEKIDDLG